MTWPQWVLLIIAAAFALLTAAAALLGDLKSGEAHHPRASATISAVPPGPAPPSPAATTRTAHPPDVPAMVRALRSKGIQVIPLGRHGKLEGWLVELAADNSYTLYTSPEGYAVAGLLYGPDGALLTAGQLAASGRNPVRPGKSPASSPPAPADDGADLLARAALAAGFTLGREGPSVTLFGDPTCPWSRSAAATLADRALQGDLRLRIIPVGVLGERSRQLAAAILAHARPDQAWFGHVAGDPTDAARAQLAANNAAFDAWGENFVPLIAWRSADGKIRRHTGEIGDIDAWLAEIDG